MRRKIDTAAGTLIVLFVAAYILAGRGVIDLGPYTITILVVIFFTLYTYYDQYRRPHMERNYIFIFSMAGLYIGVGIGYLVNSGSNSVLYGGVLGLLVTWSCLYLFRKPFYAWLDRLVGQGDEGNT
jgi:uncharacterized membrane protein YfcA